MTAADGERRPNLAMRRRPSSASAVARASALAVALAAVGLLVVAGAVSVTTAAEPDRSISAAWLGSGDIDLRPLPDPEPAPDEARRTADEILAGAEYREVDDQSLLERVQIWVQTQFGRVLQAIFSGGGGAVATWLLVAGVLGGLGYFGYRMFRTIRPDPGVRLRDVVEVRRRPDEWRRDAERHEQAGEWKEALRCRFRALVGDLVDRGTLKDVPGRTAGEYRREVRAAAPQIAGGFAEATEIFERAWYGDEPTGPVENERFRSLAERVVSEAPR